MSDPQFIENIKLWVSCDNKIEEVNNNLKSLRNQKTKLSNEITSFMERNQIEDTIINISDGQNIKYCQQNSPNPLTFKFLEESLLKYFDNDSDKVSELISFIKSNRSSKKECFLRRNKK